MNKSRKNKSGDIVQMNGLGKLSSLNELMGSLARNKRGAGAKDDQQRAKLHTT